MESTLTWLDLTASDRDRMRRVLDLFSEQGTIDEMGLGSLRDALSNALFPGMSSIQTRLRYMLFIPWMYQKLEARGVDAADVAQQARKEEIGMIGCLKESPDTDGIIGARAHGSLMRLPSSVYWTALVRWGIFGHEKNQGWYHTHFARSGDGGGDVGRTDDPGVTWSRRPNWHPRLPEKPALFPEQVSFALTRDEADFLRGRVQERCPGTLLEWLAREGSDTLADDFWDDPCALQAGPDVASLVELARRFSLHVEGMALLYNLLIAERRYSKYGSDDDELIGKYRAKLAEWADREAGESACDPHQLWAFIAGRGGRLPDPQRRFIEKWTQELTDAGPAAVADNKRLRTLVAERELRLKGARRARLVDEGKLLDWNGRVGVGVGRMDFRWFRVRQLLVDLHQGLAA